jgi:hypothetical protein
LADDARVPHTDFCEVHDVVTRARLAASRFRRIQNAALADFQEAAVVGEYVERCAEKGLGERVENAIDTEPFRKPAHFVSEVESARIHYMVDALLLQQRALGLAAGRSEYFCAGAQRNLNRNLPNTARARVYEYSLSRAQLAEHLERIVRSQKRRRQRRRQLVAERWRLLHDAFGMRDRVRPEAAERRPKHRVSDPVLLHFGPDGSHDSRAFDAE